VRDRAAMSSAKFWKQLPFLAKIGRWLRCQGNKLRARLPIAETSFNKLLLPAVAWHQDRGSGLD
jgi:hypothetical protein